MSDVGKIALSDSCSPVLERRDSVSGSGTSDLVGDYLGGKNRFRRQRAPSHPMVEDAPTKRAKKLPAEPRHLDHDEFGLSQSKLIDVIDSNILERDL